MFDFESMHPRRHTGSRKWKVIREDPRDVPEDVCPLAMADMEFKVAPAIVQGLQKVLENESLGYNDGDEGFYEAVADWICKRHGICYEKEEMLPVAGVVRGFYSAIRELTGPKAGVIIFSPVYNPFSKAIDAAGRKIVSVPLLEPRRGHFEIDYEGFEKACAQEENEMLLFCNPHNPVGRVWSREELTKLVAIAKRYDILVVSDEIWADLTMPGHRQTMLASVDRDFARRNIITCMAASKTFNLAGLETSVVLIEDPVLRREFEERAYNNYSLGTNFLGMRATEIAFREGEPWLRELLWVIDKNQRFVHDYFKQNDPRIKAPLIEGTYVQWIDLRDLGLSQEEIEERCRKAYLYVNQGTLFGEEGEGFIRINLACPQKVLKTQLDRFVAVLMA